MKSKPKRYKKVYGLEFHSTGKKQTNRYIYDVFRHNQKAFTPGFLEERKNAYKAVSKKTGESYGPAFDRRYKNAYQWYKTKVKRYQATGESLRQATISAGYASLPDEERFKYMLYASLNEYPEAKKRFLHYIHHDGDRYDIEELKKRLKYTGSQDLYIQKTSKGHDIEISFVPSPQDIEITSPQIDQLIEEEKHK